MSHAIKIDNDVIQEFISLDDDDMRLVFTSLQRELKHCSATLDTDCPEWWNWDEREQHCARLIDSIRDAWRPAWQEVEA